MRILQYFKRWALTYINRSATIGNIIYVLSLIHNARGGLARREFSQDGVKDALMSADLAAQWRFPTAYSHP
jgi:hypothetical protein